MAVLKIPYKGVAHSLPYLRKQVLDSIRYCIKNIPEFKNPEDLFYYLKSKTIYQSDPEGVELFQTVPTLLEHNKHGKSGKGDCDCFTILTLASLIANGYYNVGIVLVGRQKHKASHIYSYVDTSKGRKYLDLTNKEYNYQRSYPYRQEIPLSISKNQIDMFLQLADGAPKRKRKKKLAYDPYIFMPSTGLRVREDQYDHLTLKDFSDCMLSEGYDLEQISTLASRRTERKAERPRQIAKKQRQDTRQAKAETKMEVKKAKAQAKTVKAESKAQARTTRASASQTRADAKKIKQERKNVDAPEEKPMTRIMDVTGNVIGKVVGNQVVPESEEPEEAYDEDGNVIETMPEEIYEESNEEELQDDANNYIIFGTPVNKKAVNVLGIATIIGIGYKLLK